MLSTPPAVSSTFSVPPVCAPLSLSPQEADDETDAADGEHEQQLL